MLGKTVRSDLPTLLGGQPAVFRIWGSRQFQKIATICAGIQFLLEYEFGKGVIWGIPS